MKYVFPTHTTSASHKQSAGEPEWPVPECEIVSASLLPRFFCVLRSSYWCASRWLRRTPKEALQNSTARNQLIGILIESLGCEDRITFESLFQAHPWPHLIKRRFVIAVPTLPHALRNGLRFVFPSRWDISSFLKNSICSSRLHNQNPFMKFFVAIPCEVSCLRRFEEVEKGLRPHSSHAASSLFVCLSYFHEQTLVALDDESKQKLQKSCIKSNDAPASRQHCFEMCRAMWDYLFNISEIIMLARLLTLDPRCSTSRSISTSSNLLTVSARQIALASNYNFSWKRLHYVFHFILFTSACSNPARETKAKDANTFDHNKS